MENIDELYDKYQTLINQSSVINDKLLFRLLNFEDKVIHEEVAPILIKEIEPLLAKIKRNIVFIIDYDPDKGIKVSLSKRRKQTETLKIIDDSEFSQSSTNDFQSTSRPRGKGMAPTTILRVEFPDGTIINEDTAVGTLIKCLCKIGIDLVDYAVKYSGSKILRPNNIPLVSRTKSNVEIYAKRQHQIANGWYVFDNTSTKVKKEQLEFLAKYLKSDMIISIVSK